MKAFLILPIMVFLHVVADYNLQGILASMKQKTWWGKQVKNLGQSMYKNDYKAALAAHCFEWSFCIMIPCLVSVYTRYEEFDISTIKNVVLYLLVLFANVFGHYAIDDVKANEKRINLVDDQILHMVQIALTWIFMTITVGW